MSPRAALDRLYDAAGYLAAFFVFAIFVVMIGQTVMRELSMRTGGTDDIELGIRGGVEIDRLGVERVVRRCDVALGDFDRFQKRAASDQSQRARRNLQFVRAKLSWPLF